LNPVLLFGGTFDPVHLGHVALARAGMAQLNAKSLIVFPAGNPYQKGRAPLASGTQRVAMLRLAFAENNVVVDERELIREGPTYTFNTLTELRRERGNDESFVWLIGEDAFSKLDTWHQWEALFTLANFAVIARAGAAATRSATLDHELKARETQIGQLTQYRAGHWARLATTPPQISSTELRLALANHQRPRGMVPDAVCDYIEQHQLYQGQNFNNG
jgi:nicotinate-nucleotide adenylyltransferase